MAKICTQIYAKIFIILSLVFAVAGVAGAEVNITGLRSGTVEIGEDQAARIVIETSSPAQVSMFLLSDPYRLVLDFASSEWAVKNRDKTGQLQTPPLSKYRFGKPNASTSRLVIELNNPAAPVRAFRLAPNGNGHRFVVDMLDRGETAFRVASRALLKNRDKPLNLGVVAPTKQPVAMLMPTRKPLQQKVRERDANGLLLPIPHPLRGAKKSTAPLPIRPVVSATSHAENNSKWVVFIDAGHGGKDPGAIGVTGQQEKEVTLKAALELARQLNATGEVRAVLSRTDDRYHKLRKRINLARSEKADVFISLHADAAHTRKARGVSVFTLSENASDKEAARLASRENKSDLIGGPDLETTDPAVTTALLGMFQRESMNQSSVLAKEIIAEFTGLPTPKRGHRFAGFAVLKSPDVPSVLIEMGFLTNKADEKNLKSSAYRKDLMRRITSATLRYLRQNSSSR